MEVSSIYPRRRRTKTSSIQISGPVPGFKEPEILEMDRMELGMSETV